ncbi:hypothetical protein H8E88_16645 [candidate division KSB1 bacterium]|nr:hypothetical protein [candidate division KSB1 bacterium]
MNQEKNYIIFFRSEKNFVEPRLDQFPFDKVELTTIDIGDIYEAFKFKVDKIIEAVDIVQGYTDTIYLCGACPNGFTWLLRRLLEKHFSGVNFVWLQMTRNKNKSPDLRQYEIWKDLETDNIL